ncbi:tannase/feruloyl esterase family alpha/beta hydrolase [Micromonospora sp. DT81.3]|uniref:tannase/feruloyl esterase family alpha/beta hydrolase n=1 Tax=Micromonospora sp. DT81.3 TaxID=3416523 RepID=UPI003CF6952E
MTRWGRGRSALVSALATGALLMSAAIAPVSAAEQSSDPPQLTAAQPGTLAECEGLAEFAYPSTVIDGAEVVPAGSVNGVEVGEHCLVTGRMNERVSDVDGATYAIGFEMRLPVAWSGRFLYQANGGLDGAVVPALGGTGGGESGLQMGFAVISSDAGHSGSQGPVFGLDPQARLDYGYQAVGTLTPMAKALIEAGYGRGPDRSYMTGGSNGGRHTMVGAARYADQYDGFLPIAPGFNLPQAAVAQIWGAQRYATVATDPADISTALTPAERAVIAASVLARCDALDGLADGMVQASALCQQVFSLDRDVPTCDADRDETCLTVEQKSVVSDIFAGARTSDGEPIYSSFPFDPGLVQPGWGFWEFTASVALDPGAVGYLFTTPPDAPPLASLPAYALGLDIDAAAASIYQSSGIYTESAMSYMTPPDPTNLERLRDRGGKMIVVHGASDAVFSADDTAAWYDQLDARNDGDAERFVRYFEVPGMGHVQGGPATDQYAALAALVDWVEQGHAPDRLVASVSSTNAEVPASWSPTRTRPLCVYPSVAVYREGDRESADSFVCDQPATPVGVTAPVVSGQPDVGRTLSATPGEWAGENLAFSYRWLRDGVAIPGATAPTYLVRSADQGKALTVEVTASDGSGTANATSAGVTVRWVSAAVVTTTPLLVAAASRPVTVTVRILPLRADAEGTVTVTTAGRTFTGTAADGKVAIPVGKLPRGVHAIVAVYEGSAAVAPTKGYGVVVVR